MSGDIRLVFIKEGNSKKQSIKFYETLDKKLVLALNNKIQFIEEDEKIYHNALTKVAFEVIPNAKNYLILGGGDGLVAREIFKFTPDAKIILIDYDEEMINLFKTDDRLVALNEGSLFGCNIINEDAFIWVKNNQDKKFDVIIHDLPNPHTDELKRLYAEEFFITLINLLNVGGVFSIQCHETFASKIETIIQKLLDKAIVTYYETPSFGDGSVTSGVKNAYL